MSLEELLGMLANGEMLDETFGQREVGIQFNLAMMTQVNEIDNDRHIKMSITEFIDAFGRIADKFNFDVRLKLIMNFIYIQNMPEDESLEEV